MDYSSAFVCLMGMGTVFFGLICIVALCYAMSAVCRRTERRKAVPAIPAETGDRGELVASLPSDTGHWNNQAASVHPLVVHVRPLQSFWLFPSLWSDHLFYPAWSLMISPLPVDPSS